MAINITDPLDYHRKNSDEEVPEVADSERIFVIVGVVTVLIVLQIIGFIICCKDRWVTKRQLRQNQLESQPMSSQNLPAPNQPIEITEILTTAREPKKAKVFSEDTTNNDAAAMALLTRIETPQGGEGDQENSSVVQVHRVKETTEPEETESQSAEENSGTQQIHPKRQENL